jgi:hypothetical protein
MTIDTNALPKLSDPYLAAKMFALGQAEGIAAAAEMLIAFMDVPSVQNMSTAAALDAAAQALMKASNGIKAANTKGLSS